MNEPAMHVSESNTRIQFQDLVALLSVLFLKNGASPEVAAILADNCASAERDGAVSHGVFRIPAYLSTLKSGYVDGKAIPRVVNVSASLVSVDACNGFAQPALAAASALAIQRARETGVAAIAITHSHHYGALWIDVEAFVRQGFVALTMVSGVKRVAPYGGNRAFYGTNPMAFGAPRAGGPPLVFDQASSAMAFGEVKLAAQQGRSVPPGTGLDRAGEPTTDPQAILDGGTLLAFGQHKGSSISMMVEIMAAGLTGSLFSFEVDRSKYPGAETSRSGQFMLLIDPAAGSGSNVASRVEELANGLREHGQKRLPGDHRYARRKESEAKGIEIGRKTLADLQARASS